MQPAAPGGLTRIFHNCILEIHLTNMVNGDSAAVSLRKFSIDILLSSFLTVEMALEQAHVSRGPQASTWVETL